MRMEVKIDMMMRGMKMRKKKKKTKKNVKVVVKMEENN
jgi:hypothetical protein